jgi:hypothetical protein
MKEYFTTKCINCGPVEVDIQVESHDEYSFDTKCHKCSAIFPEVFADASDYMADWFGSQIDDVMNRMEAY